MSDVPNSDEYLIIKAFENGDYTKTQELCDRVLETDSDNVNAHHALSLMAFYKKEYNLASEHIKKVLEQRPNFSDAWNNLGLIFLDQKDHSNALDAFNKAILYNPKSSTAFMNRSVAYVRLGNLEQAEEDCAKAIMLRPRYGEAYNNLGLIRVHQGRVEESLDLFDKAIQANSGGIDFHFNKGVSLLALGRLREGWREYAWRLRTEENRKLLCTDSLWDGSEIDLNGKTLLIHYEQGFGDTVQFSRYIPEIKKRAPNCEVIFRCQPELKRLFQSIKGVDHFIGPKDVAKFDLWCPLLNLPVYFNTNTVEDIPGHLVPHIEVSRSIQDFWAERVSAWKRYLKIGIVWRGSKDHKYDKQRSVTIKHFERFGNSRNTVLFSFQKDATGDELESSAIPIVDLGKDFQDFADTAAALKQMDLVISVDTSIVHVAGTFGIPTWVMVPYVQDWRWMVEREDTPWYKSLRLFRQTKLNDWIDVFDKVEKELLNYELYWRKVRHPYAAM